MGHGQVDFGMYSPKETVYPISDMSELAARLGSIVTFDRRGDVIWLDDFESDINCWEAVVAGTFSQIVASALHARSGGFSAKLTAGDEVDSYAFLYRHFPYPVLGKIGFEISFTVDDDCKVIETGFVSNNGVIDWGANVRYDPAADTLAYMYPANVWVPFATSLDLRPNDYHFHTAKLVVDIKTGKYERFILDDVEYDLSAHAYDTWGAPAAPLLRAFYAIYNVTGEIPVSWADDGIATQNEP